MKIKRGECSNPQLLTPKSMKTNHPLNRLPLALIAGLVALPLITHAGQHPRYKLIDLGTFGGPSSRVEDSQRVCNNRGAVIGVADTASPDPFNPNCASPNCVVQHAFKWQNGVLTDLGALFPGGSSQAIHINERGQVVGASENGLIDP